MEDFLFPHIKMVKFFKKNYLGILYRLQKKRPSLVTFTGGMGAQMLSAAIYFQMQSEGQEVYADLSYFDTPLELAKEGVKGKVSHWGWQLHGFNLYLESFVTIKPNLNTRCHVIADGAMKLSLGLSALKQEKIQPLFAVTQPIQTSLLGEEASGHYLCIHVRRGDYSNVASHLVSEQAFFDIAKRFTHLVEHAVIVSDSIITAEFRVRISTLFRRASFLDAINEYESHCVMRNASILVCSNSQFSLIAALLNKTGLVVVPRTWFGQEQAELEAILSNLGDFQILP